MFKFRRETWGKKIDHEREWSTSYSDVIRGYGKFHSNNLIHLRKAPKVHQAKLPLYQKPPEPLAPKVDHMWDVLQRKGIAGYGNSRQKLNWLLKEQRKKRAYQHRTPRTAAPEQHKNNKQAKWYGYGQLPPVDSEQDSGRITNLVTLRDVQVTMPRQETSRWRQNLAPGYSYGRSTPVNNSNVHYGVSDPRDRIYSVSTPRQDPDGARGAGLPSTWIKKPAPHVSIPPACHSQRPPLRLAYSKDPEYVAAQEKLNRRSGARVSARMTPPTPMSRTPLPEIRRRRCAHDGTPTSQSGATPPFSERYPLPEVKTSRTPPDISYIVDRRPSTPELDLRLTASRAWKHVISAR